MRASSDQQPRQRQVIAWSFCWSVGSLRRARSRPKSRFKPSSFNSRRAVGSRCFRCMPRRCICPGGRGRDRRLRRGTRAAAQPSGLAAPAPRHR